METLFNNDKNEDGGGTNKFLQTKHWDFVSLLYKSARIGDAKTAVVCAEVIRQIIGEYRVILILNQIIGEDVSPLYYSKIYPVVGSYTATFQSKIQKNHNLWQTTYLIAKSPKWYMDNAIKKFNEVDFFNGEELENIRQYLKRINIRSSKEKDNSENLIDFVANYNFPKWTYDSHTRKGIADKHNGTANLILDGGWDNRFRVKEKWDKVFNENPNDSYNELLSKYRKYINEL
jgi:hypothetical protein